MVHFENKYFNNLALGGLLVVKNRSPKSEVFSDVYKNIVKSANMWATSVNLISKIF